MVSPKLLLATVESALLGPSPPTPSQRIELMHAIRVALPSLQSLLSYPPPKPSDRSQVQSKEVRLPDSSPISLDDQDVQIALKLSDDLHLNEIECVRLLVSANQEWGLLGREPLEILRLAAGLWYTDRRDLITALYTLLRAVVLDRGLEADLVADIQKYLEDLINAGLRQRLISLLKELNREEPAGLGGPHAEQYVIDSRGALVERRAVVCRERLILGHCIVLSVLVVRMSPKDIKDVFSALKDCTFELNGSNATIKLQIAFSLLFSLLIAFISDALSAVPDKVSVLSCDAPFRREFQELVLAGGHNENIEGFVDATRLAWTVHLMLLQDGNGAVGTISSASSSDLGNIYSCLDVVISNNVFQFMLDKILRTAAYQNDDEDMIYMYNAYLHKLMSCFLSHPLARDKVKEIKEKAMSMLSPYLMAGSHDLMHDNGMTSEDASETHPQPFVSLLELVSEIYQKEPELMSGNEVLWTFVHFAGEDHTNIHTLVAFLKVLSTLASSQEGASKVFELLQGKAFRSVGWITLFDSLSIYEQKFKQSLQSAVAGLPEFQEGDAKALVAYLNVLQKVLENGDPTERKNWFPNIEPLFKLLSYENVPPYLKGALRNAIVTFIQVSPMLKDTVWSYLEQYDLPVVVGPPVGSNVQNIATQPTVAAIEAGKHIALANKETLIAGGPFVLPLAHKHKVKILPADSEHSAIFQCIQGLPEGALRRIILTASGGAFRDWPVEKLKEVKVADALKHPNWNMGKKITVDSATLFNKGLEVIEAHYLFGAEYDNIEIVIHPQSIIHSMIETQDSSVLAQLGWPDMRLPILYTLSWPYRIFCSEITWPRLDLCKLGSLSFKAPDNVKYPSMDLAYAAGRAGGTMTGVLSAANEKAVEMFIDEKISYLDIFKVVELTCDKHREDLVTTPSLDDIVHYDLWARKYAANLKLAAGLSPVPA